MEGAGVPAFIALVGEDRSPSDPGAAATEFRAILARLVEWRRRAEAGLGAGGFAGLVSEIVERFSACAPDEDGVAPLEALGADGDEADRLRLAGRRAEGRLGPAEEAESRAVAALLLMLARPRLSREALSSDPELAAALRLDAAWTAASDAEASEGT
jgi:hypothetical protein